MFEKKHMHKIVLFCGVFMCLFAHFYGEFQYRYGGNKIDQLKSEFNKKYNDLTEERAFLLKTLINNYHNVQDNLPNANVFDLPIEILSDLVKNMKVVDKIKYCEFSPKMVSCSLGSVLIPIVSFLFK